MNWNRLGKLTVADMLFVFGVMVGLGIAALIVLASVLWVVKAMLGA